MDLVLDLALDTSDNDGHQVVTLTDGQQPFYPPPPPLSPMDVNYIHTTSIHVVRACPNDDATDLLAIGGDHSVDVLLVVSSPILLFLLLFTSPTHQTDTACRPLASFHIGAGITALAWSPAAVSPSSSDHWLIE